MAKVYKSGNILGYITVEDLKYLAEEFKEDRMSDKELD